MTEWRTIAPDSKGYPGLVELTRNGRTFASMGSGDAVRRALEKALDRAK